MCVSSYNVLGYFFRLVAGHVDSADFFALFFYTSAFVPSLLAFHHWRCVLLGYYLHPLRYLREASLIWYTQE